MARIRTYKPEFFGDEKLAPMAAIHRFVFLGLISFADDAGRLVDNIKAIDGFIFPATDESSRDSLEELTRVGRIRRYASSSGQRLIQIVNWSKHQRVEHPSSYVLPAPEGSGVVTAAPEGSASPESLMRLSRSDLGPRSMDHDLGATIKSGKDLDQERAAPEGHASNGTNGNGSAAAPLFAQLPKAIHRFCRTFYDDAPRKTKLHIRDEILATLTPEGLKVGRRAYVRARSAERLATKCAEVLSEHATAPLRDPQKAWVVVIRKLQDVSDVALVSLERERESVAIDERLGGELRAAAAAWGAAHPAELERIQSRASAQFPGDSDFVAQAREAFVLSEVRRYLQPAAAMAGV